MLLESLVSQVEQKFPAVAYKEGNGSRAQAAADLVRAQQVTYVGEQAGRDYWKVNGHLCGISHGCDCNDNAPLDPNGRKLCKHRIAVMFTRRLADDHGIATILRKVTGDRCVLTVQVFSTDNGLQLTLNSYRADGAETVLEYADRVRFTDKDFTDALTATGWGMEDRPVKLAGMNHRYVLKRGAEIRYTATALTAQRVELTEQRRRMAEIVELDEAAATDPVMQGLPESVQAAILNHAGLTK